MALSRRRRSSSAVEVSKSSLEEVITELQDLPERPKNSLSLREAIAHLQVPIDEALDKGYSHEEVSTLLREEGIQISPSSLRRYLAIAKRSPEEQPPQENTAPRRGRRRKNTSMDSLESA